MLVSKTITYESRSPGCARQAAEYGMKNSQKMTCMFLEPRGLPLEAERVRHESNLLLAQSSHRKRPPLPAPQGLWYVRLERRVISNSKLQEIRIV